VKKSPKVLQHGLTDEGPMFDAVFQPLWRDDAVGHVDGYEELDGAGEGAGHHVGTLLGALHHPAAQLHHDLQAEICSIKTPGGRFTNILKYTYGRIYANI